MQLIGLKRHFSLKKRLKSRKKNLNSLQLILNIQNQLFLFLSLFLFSFANPPKRHWFCNQLRKDIKKELTQALNQSQGDIFISVYALNDPKLTQLLNKKARQGLHLKIWLDHKNASYLQEKAHPSLNISLRKQKGLMHHKIFIFDHTVYLGSANLTETSLRMHDNVMVKVHNPCFSYTLKKMLQNYSSYSSYHHPDFSFYLLPNSNALEHLLSLIENAEKSIDVALFTFTHPMIAHAISEASKRGIQVRVLIDRYTAKGASKHCAQKLLAEKVPTYTHLGSELMHHKMCFIDDEKLIMGSANWTESAFTKNYDFLICFESLTLEEKKILKRIFKALFCESKPLSLDTRSNSSFKR